MIFKTLESAREFRNFNPGNRGDEIFISELKDYALIAEVFKDGTARIVPPTKDRKKV